MSQEYVISTRCYYLEITYQSIVQFSKISRMSPLPEQSLEAIQLAYGEPRSHECYTKEDHRTWREVICQLSKTVGYRSLVPFELSLQECGIRRDSIPTQTEIDHALSKFGWQSFMVRTFIPSRDFLRLQAQRVLPITFQIRPPSQLRYTPIPDVVHEVVGHLPMLTCNSYRGFLQKLGKIGSTAKTSKIDQQVHETQTHLAELKSRATHRCQQIAELEMCLAELTQIQRNHMTPACLVSRFHWWTVEFGVFGPDYKLYGAGLLSSVDEAIASDETPKIPLSLDCLNYDYEITSIQPRLFVTEDWEHLDNELEQLQKLVN